MSDSPGTVGAAAADAARILDLFQGGCTVSQMGEVAATAYREVCKLHGPSAGDWGCRMVAKMMTPHPLRDALWSVIESHA